MVPLVKYDFLLLLQVIPNCFTVFYIPLPQFMHVLAITYSPVLSADNYRCCYHGNSTRPSWFGAGTICVTAALTAPSGWSGGGPGPWFPSRTSQRSLSAGAKCPPVIHSAASLLQTRTRLRRIYDYEDDGLCMWIWTSSLQARSSSDCQRKEFRVVEQDCLIHFKATDFIADCWCCLWMYKYFTLIIVHFNIYFQLVHLKHKWLHSPIRSWMTVHYWKEYVIHTIRIGMEINIHCFVQVYCGILSETKVFLAYKSPGKPFYSRIATVNLSEPSKQCTFIS